MSVVVVVPGRAGLEIPVLGLQGPDPRLVLDDHGFQLPDLRVEFPDLVVLLRRDLAHLLVHLLHDRHLVTKKQTTNAMINRFLVTSSARS